MYELSRKTQTERMMHHIEAMEAYKRQGWDMEVLDFEKEVAKAVEALESKEGEADESAAS